MSSTLSKLKFSLANDALIHFFHSQYWLPAELNFIRSLNFSNDSDNIRKLKLRLLYEENNDIIVAAVLADSHSDELIFLQDRYCRNFSFTKISMKLHVHPNGLQRWRDKILTDIASLLEYKLPLSDIFSRNKIEALILVLERSIVFYETYKNFDQKFLISLKIKLNFYQNLLFVIKQFLNSDSAHIGVKIIQAKILDQHSTHEEMAKNLGVSHTTISHYLRYFQQKFYPDF